MSNDDLGPFINKELFKLVCGEMLGEGIGRKVYECTFDPTLVIKFETEGGSFQNIYEWKTWKDCEHWKKAADWLAPCVSISSCGAVLIQKRVEPIHKSMLPLKIPAFLHMDLKLSHFGMYEGRVVVCDYALLDFNLNANLKTVDWQKTFALFEK